jgi:hypothetical protein
MSAVAAAVVGSAVIGGVMSNKASKDASDAAGDANQATLDQQRQMFDIQRQDFAPYQQLGEDAMPTYYRMLGISPGGTSGQMTQKELDLIADYNAYRSGTPSTTTPAVAGTTAPLASDSRYTEPIYADSSTDEGLLQAQLSGAADPMRAYQPGGVDGYSAAGGAGVGGTGAGGAGGWGGDMDALNAALRKQELIDQGAAGAGAAPELSPLAQWQMQEFNKQQNRQDAARGLAGSGSASARIGEGAMNIAGADYQNSYNRILDALKIGSGASASAGQSANQMSTAIGQAGGRQQQNILNQGQSQANMWSGLGNTVGQGVQLYQNSQSPVYDGWTAGGNPSYQPMNQPNVGPSKPIF